MTILTFVTIGLGIGLGLLISWPRLTAAMDQILNVSIASIMLMIGLNLGINDAIIRNFLSIGFQALVIALSGLSISILFTVIIERTAVPLDRTAFPDLAGEFHDQVEQSQAPDKMSWIIPLCIGLGLVIGLVFRQAISPDWIDTIFNWSLIVLLFCVGYSQGANREIFTYLRRLGFKFLLFPLAVAVGSILGGMLAGIILGLPFRITAISASGMSFYSLTGAYMTRTYGLEIGTYGFLVNVFREIIAILFAPLLARISSGAPIAAGGAASMDVVLAPITRFVGLRLSLVCLASGLVLTFIIPFLLPILSLIFG